MSLIRLNYFYLILFSILSFSFSCAPVKFSKSDSVKIDASNDNNNQLPSIKCSPLISNNTTTYTYSSAALPQIFSRCDQANLIYDWKIKKADGTTINTTIAGLTGENPNQFDLRTLGQGAYYIFLTAKDSSGRFAAFIATSPLEFIVANGGMGNSLTCNPKLNSTLSSVNIAYADANPVVSANCSPAANMYIWTVKKNGIVINISGLNGSQSQPEFKKMGQGIYLVSLYATTSGSAHWQSMNDLTVNVLDQNPPQTMIACNPKINGGLDQITLTSSSAKPFFNANCLPSDVTYTWKVIKSGQNVNVLDLVGAQSNPGFFSLGKGTYQVYLTAAKSGMASWSSSKELTVIVDGTTVTPTVSCSPRLNTNLTSVSINATTGNPSLTSNCNPTSANLNWTVYKAGQLVSISGLNGSVSKPDFLSLGNGTYSIYLTASQPSYNAYVLATPMEVVVGPSPHRHVVLTKQVQLSDNKVDVLLVVDDSSSMLNDNRKLGQRLQGFVNGLTSSNLDWQMCATVTRAQDVRGNGVYFWGASRNWINYVGSSQWILTNGAVDPYAIFTSTIEAIGAGWAGTDDERAIKSAYWHAEYADYNNCYRSDASLAVILISDEDERSVGGNAAYSYNVGELKPLESDDYAESYVNKISQKFGSNKKLVVNSIIVKPGDTTCMALQDAEGSKSHYGFQYEQLSQLTHGYVASICDSDYSTSLNYFKDRVVSTVSALQLECVPVGTVDIKVTPSMGGLSTQLQGNKITFSPAVPVGRTIDVNYDCAR